jgi:hypothetical protein
MIIAQYLVFLTLTSLIQARKKRRASRTHLGLTLLFAPIHLLYLTFIVMGSIKNWKWSADCSQNNIYPRVIIFADSLFVFVYLISLFLHWNKYFIVWDLPTRENLTFEQVKKAAVVARKKALFE